MKLDVKKTALAVGAFAGVMHVFWSLLVALGWAKAYLDLMFGLHFLSNPLRVSPFNLTTALILVAVTFGFGYLVGTIFANVWNRLQK